ncbi:hypothetical protein [Candidatus Tisiphia endosymbiont of Hybos culiciformis]
MSFLRRQEPIISQGFLSTILDTCFRRDDKLGTVIRLYSYAHRIR